MSRSISRREYLGAMAGSALLTVAPLKLHAAGSQVVPGRLRAAGGQTDFYVVTSESKQSSEFLSALVSDRQRAHVPFSLDKYGEFSEFVDSVSSCVLVGLVDQSSCVIVESKLNDIGRNLQIVEYVSATDASSLAARQAALETMQTALSMAENKPGPAAGTSGPGALSAFYAWL